jgi:hypothetical protein
MADVTAARWVALPAAYDVADWVVARACVEAGLGQHRSH